MPYEDTNLTLSRFIAAWADAPQLDEPVNSLRWAARNLAVSIYTDRQWGIAQAALQQMASENSIDGILARQRDAMSGIVNSLHRDGAVQKGSGLPSATEIQEAEADLRNHLPRIAEHLPEVEQAADKITADPTKISLQALTVSCGRADRS